MYEIYKNNKLYLYKNSVFHKKYYYLLLVLCISNQKS